MEVESAFIEELSYLLMSCTLYETRDQCKYNIGLQLSGSENLIA
jgi:hypothetical protein